MRTMANDAAETQGGSDQYGLASWSSVHRRPLRGYDGSDYGEHDIDHLDRRGGCEGETGSELQGHERTERHLFTRNGNHQLDDTIDYDAYSYGAPDITALHCDGRADYHNTGYDSDVNTDADYDSTDYHNIDFDACDADAEYDNANYDDTDADYGNTGHEAYDAYVDGDYDATEPVLLDVDGYDAESDDRADYEGVLVKLRATATDVISPIANQAVQVALPYVERVEKFAIRWMARWSTLLAQICLGVIYLWFGALKLYPDLSPAEGLVRATLAEISSVTGLPLPATPAFILLALWEIMIGFGLIIERYRRAAIWMLMLHLPMTILPFFVVPEAVWAHAPIGLTLEGQYIVKNLALLASASAVMAAIRSRPLGTSVTHQLVDD